MWILTPVEPGGETHYLLSSKEYVVGRKNCDILLPNDQSISRAHAQLTAADQTLTLKDTSKYGTFVNSQRLAENSPVNLKAGDNVTFGVFHSKFSVDHQKPVVCSSCLDNDGKASLSQVLLPLGGKLVNSWTEDCTHLAMPSAKVTIKTICALLCCRPIVKPEFFSELRNAAQQRLALPKAESFIPEIDEPSLSKEDVNLGAIPVRKQLFTGKTFIFFSAKQLRRLSAAVTFGGGTSQLLEEGSLPRGLLESPQTCVIDVMMSSSQTPLPPSITELAKSVNSIVQRKGLRVITESEIGLAAIYASCDKYCNPSSQAPTSESAPKVAPRIPSASLSQSVAVDETVLAAASQNITAYAVNTELNTQASKGTELCEETGLMAVGETPERKRNHNGSQFPGSKVTAQVTTQCIVADTMSSLFNPAEEMDSQRKKAEAKPTVSGADTRGVRPQPSLPRLNNSTKTFLQKQSPQKQNISAKASPQKQSTLTSFFQAANKKRPMDDELFAVTSEPKRPVLESSISKQTPSVTATAKEMSSRPAAASPTPLGSAAEPHSRKRKDMEAEIQMDELESLMSEDFFDEPPSGKQDLPAPLIMHRSAEQRPGLNSGKASSSSKRQRLHQDENGRNRSDRPVVSIKTEPVDPLENKTKNQESSRPSDVPSASRNTDIQPFEDDDDASFIEDLELLEADICQPEEEPKSPLKPVLIKQEVQESKFDENHPKNVVLVEFRSLTVTALPKTKPQRTANNSHTKNFKCFRKNCMAGGERSPHIIRGSDLLVHNRGKNTDVDEWLKDAAEEERQSRREESVGDDLFRYNPTKLSRRR